MIKKFFKSNWLGTIVILGATLVFFSPYLVRIDSYSAGGDAMFNAWVLSRNHHCILRDNCQHYVDGNIFFPHKDSMLYSETQLSAGLLTLPLHLINQNPIFSYNVWTIASFFFCGWFMYLLAKLLSQNHELISIFAGLVFEFAPIRMTSLYHMQNISIFYLPLIVLIIFKYLQEKKYRYLVYMFISLVLFFYASWYQMVFGIMAIFTIIGGLLLFRVTDKRSIVAVSLVVLTAVLSTLPLAREYIRFSNENNASFNENLLIRFSSSLVDYFTPQTGTVLGMILGLPSNHINAINPDSSSYYGITLYVVAIGFVSLTSFQWVRYKKINYRSKLIIIFALVGIVGFIVSLGPYIKLTDRASLPLPYLVITRMFPQLGFIRAIGRASVLVLFSLCCLLSMLPLFLKNRYYLIIVSLVVIELMPFHLVFMVKDKHAYNLSIPKVYQFIKNHQEIDKIIILHSDKDYLGARLPVIDAEETMWAGYANRYVFNGYSGYLPPSYPTDQASFTEFDSNDIDKLKQLGLKYVLVDKYLSTADPQMVIKVESLLKQKVYEDDRFSLLRIEE